MPSRPDKNSQFRAGFIFYFFAFVLFADIKPSDYSFHTPEIPSCDCLLCIRGLSKTPTHGRKSELGKQQPPSWWTEGLGGMALTQVKHYFVNRWCIKFPCGTGEGLRMGMHTHYCPGSRESELARPWQICSGVAVSLPPLCLPPLFFPLLC